MVEHHETDDKVMEKSLRNLKIIAITALVWNLLGVAAFLAQISLGDDGLSQMPQAERELYENIPLWATIAYAVAVFGGVLGSVALLMRRTYAVLFFALSLLGILLQMFHAFILAGAMSVLGAASIVMPLFVTLIGIALLVYSRAVREKGLLR